MTPHVAEGPEAELPLIAPDLVRTAVSRIRMHAPSQDPGSSAPGSADDLRALATPEVIDEAIAAFAPGFVDILGYASTSTAYVLGSDAESRLLERVSARWAVPACSTSRSAVAALRALDIERVALVHPPWFGTAFNELGTEYFGRQGFRVVQASLADVPNNPDLVTPGAVVDWVVRHISDDAEAVFIGGNGFRAARAIGAIEATLARPVLESNQVLLWSILASAAVPPDIRGFGMLFEQPSRRSRETGPAA